MPHSLWTAVKASGMVSCAEGGWLKRSKNVGTLLKGAGKWSLPESSSILLDDLRTLGALARARSPNHKDDQRLLSGFPQLVGGLGRWPVTQPGGVGCGFSPAACGPLGWGWLLGSCCCRLGGCRRLFYLEKSMESRDATAYGLSDPKAQGVTKVSIQKSC